MKDSWLVQRLRRPFGKENPFSFGGGLRSGGLSRDAVELLHGIFSFDYMGASEFEWGAVPEALARVAKAKLVAFMFTVPLADVRTVWRDPQPPAADGEATVYVLCPERDADDVAGRILAWALNGEKLLEASFFTRSLRPADEWDSDTCGWLELENGFFWFLDEEMWRKTCKLFGVET